MYRPAIGAPELPLAKFALLGLSDALGATGTDCSEHAASPMASAAVPASLLMAGGFLT